MPLGKATAVVIAHLPLGESDRLVTFFSREHGKLRGVARAARRPRSRFAGALELLTLGALVFFDTGRSDLLRIDHFDVLRPFRRVREDLDALGQAAWMAECAGRLTAERDPHPVVFELLVRGLQALERGAAPGRVALAFGLRAIDALGHRLRADACVGCRRALGTSPGLGLDLEAGGFVCPACRTPGLMPVGPDAVRALRRARGASWTEALRVGLGPSESAVRLVVDAQVTHLVGQPVRTTRFIRALREAGIAGAPA